MLTNLTPQPPDKILELVQMFREEIEGVGYEYADLAEMTARYNPDTLRDGWNTGPDGERFYYISSPALGLWAAKGRLS